MKTLTLAMIVKNEQAVIERLLSKVYRIFDQIIIVDTGSNDDTVSICQQYGEVYHFEWQDHFAKARNYAFSLAKKEYIMWLDADDILSDRDCDLILAWKNSASSPDTVMAKYVVAKDSSGKATFWYYRERIVRNCSSALWLGAIHETIQPFGEIQYAEFVVEHSPLSAHTNRNLNIFRKMLKKGETLDARLTYYYGRELYYSGYYCKAVKVFAHYLQLPDTYLFDKKEVYKILYTIYTQQGNITKARKQLFLAMQLLPSSDVCCLLGDSYLNENNLALAKQWYIFALSCNSSAGGFVEERYNLYYPCVQLTLVCDRLGEYRTSYYYHCKARESYPYDSAVQYNEQYFATHQELLK